MARLASSLRRAASADSATLGGLGSQKSQSGDDEVQVMPSVWTIWSTPLFHMTQNDQYRQSPGNLKQKRPRSRP